jgi:prepilin-type N-terminal cleavage/methylation domain-containing protein
MHVSSIQGFTLIETLVAMVLLVLCLALVLPSITNAFDSTRKSAATTLALNTVGSTLGLLENDVRSAKSPNRSIGSTSQLDGLRDAVLNGTTLNGLDIRDIVAASPIALWVHSNAITEPAGAPVEIECVGYTVSPGIGLQRIVGSAGGSCPASGMQPTTMLPMTASLPTQVFSYTMLTNPTASGKLDPSARCVTSESTTPGQSARELNRIVAVHIDLNGFVVRGRNYGEGSAATTVALRERASGDYLYALGCENS